VTRNVTNGHSGHHLVGHPLTIWTGYVDRRIDAGVGRGENARSQRWTSNNCEWENSRGIVETAE